MCNKLPLFIWQIKWNCRGNFSGFFSIAAMYFFIRLQLIFRIRNLLCERNLQSINQFQYVFMLNQLWNYSQYRVSHFLMWIFSHRWHFGTSIQNLLLYAWVFNFNCYHWIRLLTSLWYELTKSVGKKMQIRSVQGIAFHVTS